MHVCEQVFASGRVVAFPLLHGFEVELRLGQRVVGPGRQPASARVVSSIDELLSVPPASKNVGSGYAFWLEDGSDYCA
jgi:hypothetical protein